MHPNVSIQYTNTTIEYVHSNVRIQYISTTEDKVSLSNLKPSVETFWGTPDKYIMYVLSFKFMFAMII